MNDKEKQIVLDNLGLIYVAIKQLCLSWETQDEFQDYYDNGLIGLINGVKAFKDSKKLKPSTFLIPCIKNEISNYITAKMRKKRFNECGRTISLNVLIGDNEDSELIYLIKDENLNIEELVERKIQIETIIHKINKMKNIKDALVLKMYFGLEGFTSRNMREISEILKVSEQMIRIRLVRGLERLKKDMKEEIE